MLHAVLITGMILLSGVRLDPSDEVRAAIDRFAEAYAAADVAVLDALVADPYLHVHGAAGTVIGREEWLARVADRRSALATGALVVERYEVEELTIRMRRESANVTGVVVSEEIRAGEPSFTRIRFTAVWVLEAGHWRRAMFHDSALP